MKDLEWKYVHLQNEEWVHTLICIFCNKIAKWDIYRHKQHLNGEYKNAKKSLRYLEHVQESWILSLYVWSVFIYFLLIRLRFSIIFEDTCA